MHEPFLAYEYRSNVLPERQHRALYAAFDRFPSRKGAAVHIAHMARVLFDFSRGGLLYVLGDPILPVYQREESIEILRYVRTIPNLLDRAVDFGRRLEDVVRRQRGHLALCHVRDPWSGVPVVRQASPSCKIVYEINGLPSIELPHAYPGLTPRTLEKVRAMERFCWSRADAIVTPSRTLHTNLERLGVPPGKITVIPNGADIAATSPRRPPFAHPYILYFGALQRWQGVDVLLRAFRYLTDYPDLHLVVCVSTRPKHAKPYRKLARPLGVASRIIWQFGLDEDELAPWRAHALVSVAPLVECARNLDQGCCPLKILESMAAGVPVVASDLPVVRELVADGEHGLLVRPGRPAALARAIRTLLDHPEHRRTLGHQARAHVARHYTWDGAERALHSLYASLCPEWAHATLASPASQS